MSRPYLPIETADATDVFFLGAVSRYSWDAFQALFEWLHDRYLIKDGDIAEIFQERQVRVVMQRIVNLCPRIDVSEEAYGFPIEAVSDLELQLLFFGDGVNAAKLVDLHQYEPLPTQQWRIDEDRVPVPGTDDPRTDLLASLSSVYDPINAMALLRTLSPRDVDRLMWEIAEIQRNPVERDQEDLANDFSAWKEENQPVYRESLGLEFNFPTAEMIAADGYSDIASQNLPDTGDFPPKI